MDEKIEQNKNMLENMIANDLKNGLNKYVKPSEEKEFKEEFLKYKEQKIHMEAVNREIMMRTGAGQNRS